MRQISWLSKNKRCAQNCVSVMYTTKLFLCTGAKNPRESIALSPGEQSRLHASVVQRENRNPPNHAQDERSRVGGGGHSFTELPQAAGANDCRRQVSATLFSPGQEQNANADEENVNRVQLVGIFIIWMVFSHNKYKGKLNEKIHTESDDILFKGNVICRLSSGVFLPHLVIQLLH
jgi:hypothetical protein